MLKLTVWMIMMRGSGNLGDRMNDRMRGLGDKELMLMNVTGLVEC